MFPAGFSPYYVHVWPAGFPAAFPAQQVKKPTPFCIADILSVDMAEAARAAARGSAGEPRPGACPRVAEHSPGARPDARPAPSVRSADLKFGVDRILGRDFGAAREKVTGLTALAAAVAQSQPARYPCYGSSRHPGTSHPGYPPYYPAAPGADVLPGPYAILNADSQQNSQPKRKRTWSRAVFSNLQRKGLEKRFDIQKYVTKPDRKQLASMLGLTDAQVKVWFQNRRMKWRNAMKEKERQEREKAAGDATDLPGEERAVTPPGEHDETGSVVDIDDKDEDDIMDAELLEENSPDIIDSDNAESCVNSSAAGTEPTAGHQELDGVGSLPYGQ